MAKYDFGKIEKKWQEYWDKERTYEPLDFARGKTARDKEKPKFYNLMMFPYPSAEGLHVGNMYAFTGADIYGRMKRMQGYDVFQPIGLDGFGIHSENYALKIGTHPGSQAKVSEERFYKQLREIGNGFAWEEKLETYHSNYYKWTQWIFVQLFKRGLAYRKKAPVNWCPSCKTVLADEQVIAGKCERCSNEVTKKDLEQWFFRITKYAPKLLENLEKIDWSERVKIAQRNWIGKSEGAHIKFPLVDVPGQKDKKHSVEVFTTRPDTLFGATFMVVSPELAKDWLDVGWQAEEEVRGYIEKALKERVMVENGEKEKAGVFSGIYAINPATSEKIPVWISDYVLAGYGTGAIMAVPAHDERDFEFAKKFNLPIKQVILPSLYDDTNPPKEGVEDTFRRIILAVLFDPKHDRYLTLKWKKQPWTTFVTGGVEDGEDRVQAAEREIVEETGYANVRLVRSLGMTEAHFHAAHKGVNRRVLNEIFLFELVDDKRIDISTEEKEQYDVEWLTFEKLQSVGLQHAEKDIIFDRIKSGVDAYTGEGYLINSGKFDGMESEKARWEIIKSVGGKRETRYRLRDWLLSRQRYWGPPIPMIYCEECARLPGGQGWHPVREEDLPVELPFVEDFKPKGKDESPLATVPGFYETDCPECGGKARRETDVSDTFLDSAWYYLRYPNVGENDVPWKGEVIKKWLPVDLYTGGAEHSVLHLLYVRFLALALHEEKLLNFGESPAPEGEPFPKFRAHGLLIKEGAKMSKSKGNIVNPDEYIKRFGADTLRMYLMFIAPFEQGGDFRDSGILGISRFLGRVWKFESGSGNADKRVLHRTIKKVTEDIESFHYNTAISALMILLNFFEEQGASRVEYEVFLKLLAPFAPHITDELWEKSGGKTSIHLEPWPEYDPKLIEEEKFELVVQINGKTRATVTAEKGLAQEDAEKLALSVGKVKDSLEDKKPKKIVFVPNRLINFVV